MEPVEYTYFEETADDESANEEAAVLQDRESSAPSSSSSDYSSASTSDEQDDESDQDGVDNDEEGHFRDDQDEEEPPQAPSFAIPSRTISAVEHPFLVMNVDKALDSFGPNPQYDSVMLTLPPSDTRMITILTVIHRSWTPVYLSSPSLFIFTPRTLLQDP